MAEDNEGKEKKDGQTSEPTSGEPQSIGAKPGEKKPVVEGDNVNKGVLSDDDIKKIEDTVVSKVLPQLINKDKKEYSLDEVNNLVIEATKKGAKITKDQLYSEIDKLKVKVKEATDTIKSLKEKTDGDKSAELSAIEQEKALLLEKLKIIEDKAVEAISTSNKLKSDIEKERINSYISKRIMDEKGKLIAGMVKGNTKEEVEASIVEAKAEYEKIENGIKERLNLPAEPTPDIDNDGNPIEPKPISVNRIENTSDLRDYSKKRDNILKQVYAEHGLKF